MATEFWRNAGRILNSKQTRTLILSGQIHDLFFHDEDDGPGRYVSLIELLTTKWDVADKILVVYELNGPIRFLREEDRGKLKNAWLKWRTGFDSNDLAIRKMLNMDKMKAEIDSLSNSFESNLKKAIGHPTMALETLRQLCICSRTVIGDKPVLEEDLLIIIEGGDMLIPEGEITRLSDADRHRISICHDWFSDPGFMGSNDAVTLIAESRSMMNQRIASLPQILAVDIPAADETERLEAIKWFEQQNPTDKKLQLWSTREDLARFTAGLSIHALLQLLKGAIYEDRPLKLEDVIDKVEQYIQSQLGDDVVEFKKPKHTLDDVVGFSNLKDFLQAELIPRFKASGLEALPGAAVCGPIGCGKTYIFEALAAELDMVVLVLKNIRSQYFGQTDVLLERLRRVLEALNKVMIFIDEADTQFGGVGAETHSTERRLTGKIQAMMSDPKLRGRVVWLLMTARIHRLSPDIRRPGRVGDLIIPILDPKDEDRRGFINWMVKKVLIQELSPDEFEQLNDATKGAFAASFASMRSELIAKGKGGKLEFEKILAIIHDHLPPPILETRRYQTLQALTHCTRRSLLPDPSVSDEQRQDWVREIREMEARGIS